MKNQIGAIRLMFVIYMIVLGLFIAVSAYVVFGENGLLCPREANLVINETNSTTLENVEE